MTDADRLGLQIICAGKLALFLCDDYLVGNRLIAGGGHLNLVGAGAKRNGGVIAARKMPVIIGISIDRAVSCAAEMVTLRSTFS